MSTDESHPPAAQPEGNGQKPAGRTGEGSQSIVAELAHHHRRVDDLVNRVDPPDDDGPPRGEAA